MSVGSKPKRPAPLVSFLIFIVISLSATTAIIIMKLNTWTLTIGGQDRVGEATVTRTRSLTTSDLFSEI